MQITRKRAQELLLAVDHIERALRYAAITELSMAKTFPDEMSPAAALCRKNAEYSKQAEGELDTIRRLITDAMEPF